MWVPAHPRARDAFLAPQKRRTAFASRVGAVACLGGESVCGTLGTSIARARARTSVCAVIYDKGHEGCEARKRRKNFLSISSERLTAIHHPCILGPGCKCQIVKPPSFMCDRDDEPAGRGSTSAHKRSPVGCLDRQSFQRLCIRPRFTYSYSTGAGPFRFRGVGCRE